MHGKKSFLALSTAFAALFVGCEWTGTSESDSWSSAYDAMNFSGTYRAVTTATSLNDDSSAAGEKSGIIPVSKQSAGNFKNGSNVASGATKTRVVPGTFQVTAGNYVWNDDGNGKLIFTNPQSGAASGEEAAKGVQNEPAKDEAGSTIKVSSGQKAYSWTLSNIPLVENSVTVKLSGGGSFTPSGSVELHPVGISGSCRVNWKTGVISMVLSSPADFNGNTLTTDYSYIPGMSVSDSSESAVTGSGTILYDSGAWTAQINPAMKSQQPIFLSYSYYADGTQPDITYTTIYSSDEVSALTVAQNGQNLSITLNNGIVMSGKFTNVQQTGKVNQDTNAGYNTYNAQFQVQTPDSKMVGSLNYDLKTGYRMLNGSWTWGKNTYDVQAVGPAWLNSADASTLSAGVQQSQK